MLYYLFKLNKVRGDFSEKLLRLDTFAFSFKEIAIVEDSSYWVVGSFNTPQKEIPLLRGYFWTDLKS